MRSENRLLAWGHARVIENLMLQRHRMEPLPVRAISDQFATEKATVAKALMSLGREIELVQRHKAEDDLAVAAASILARDEFVRRLQKLDEQYDSAAGGVKKSGRRAGGHQSMARLPRWRRCISDVRAGSGLPEPRARLEEASTHTGQPRVHCTPT
jgi:hypothetical protein